MMKDWQSEKETLTAAFEQDIAAIHEKNLQMGNRCVPIPSHGNS